jgi:hypothetical protein
MMVISWRIILPNSLHQGRRGGVRALSDAVIDQNAQQEAGEAIESRIEPTMRLQWRV